MYLRQFTFLDSEREFDFFRSIQRTCYDSFYPFNVIRDRLQGPLVFSPITILYGGNGSGKTTMLNVIAEKLKVDRDALYNRSNFFEDYLSLCEVEAYELVDKTNRIITSDDVFDYMLNLRALNEGIDLKREEVFKEFLDTKYADFKYRTMEDYEELKKVNKARRLTQSKYTRASLVDNVRELSNGESGFKYFTESIQDPGLYLLDEPENSLSPANQIELAKFLEDSARFFGAQLVIATHSPFLLSMKGAKIYDLDREPIRPQPWTELENVRVMQQFFRDHEEQFREL